ncbi:unnamed protein product [Blepharisma stoltei]|uniref:Uncharacterized protein n=1 Tax=Blepharisma stoltei TaxID=1481888 RepID=A0AAU9JMH4_9CILI|nr:unnamed protein product [Blepharisma stoltei]
MYAPNSIHGKLGRRNEEGSIGALLSEVNDTIEKLNSWKEEEKRLDEEFNKKLLVHNNPSQEIADEEEKEEHVDLKEINIDNIRHRQIEMVKVTDVSVPGKNKNDFSYNIDGSSLYEVGTKLNEMLSEWKDSVDIIDNNKNKAEKGEEWEKIEDIEKELAELESMLDSVGSGDNIEDS